ncbi:hypothetical protein [Virgibacillus ainsalahensis]
MSNRAAQLREAAKRNPFQSQSSHGQLVSLRMYIQMPFQYQEHLSELIKEKEQNKNDRKRNEGKPHKVAVIACANKLVHWIHAMLKRQEVFVDQP